MKVSRILKNLPIFLVAPLLALGLFLLTRDLSGLTASVLDLTELKKIEDEKRGVAYKTKDQLFELFGSEGIKKAKSLTFELIYNPEKIRLFPEQSSSSHFKILKNDNGTFQVQLTELPLLHREEGWFQVPFSWEMTQILLAGASLETETGSQTLSIGNLNPHDEHSVLP